MTNDELAGLAALAGVGGLLYAVSSRAELEEPRLGSVFGDEYGRGPSHRSRRVAKTGDYGAGFEVKLDCCWTRKQRNRVRSRINGKISDHNIKMNRALGRNKGGLEMMRRAQSPATYIWTAAWHQKRIKKLKKWRRKVNSCKKFPCFPSFKWKRKKGGR